MVVRRSHSHAEPLTRSAECCWRGSYRSLTVVVVDEPFVSFLRWRTAHVIPAAICRTIELRLRGRASSLHRDVDPIVDEDHGNATIGLPCARVI